MISINYIVSLLSNVLNNVIDRNWNCIDFEFKCKNPGEYLIVFRCDMMIKESGKMPLLHFSEF